MGDWSDIASSAAATAQAAASIAAPVVKNRSSWKYTKKAMALQNQYNEAAFDRSFAANTEWQKHLLTHSNLYNKMSLRNAGYSTADPNGTGVSAPSVSTPSLQSAPSGAQFQSASFDMPSFFTMLADVRKINSEARLNEIQEKYQAALYEGEIGKLNAEIKQINDLLPERIQEIRANVSNLVSQNVVNQKQADKLVQETDNLKEVVKGIQIDNRYKADINEQTKQKLINEVSLLSKEGRIKEAEAKLADMGIVLSHSGMAAIVSAALNGKANDIATQLGDSIVKLTEGLPDIVRNVMSAIYKALSDAGADVLNKLKNIF